MKVFVVGIRGFPGIQGGAEKACEQLYSRLIKFGLDITVFARVSYFSQKRKVFKWKEINFFYLPSPKKSGLETFVHSFLSSLLCVIKRPDLVHFHNMGPSFFLPLVKLFGIKTVVTLHSINYHHQKWGKLAKFILKVGELCAVKFANKVVVVANFIKEFLKNKYRRKDLIVISNGVDIHSKISSGEALHRYNLSPQSYILCVSRLSPEKGVYDLIKAYKGIGTLSCKLVIVGNADIDTEYSQKIKQEAERDERIVLTGVLVGKPLEELYSNAGLFVLPSYYEGLPIALLEALSYGLPVLVSDIPAHREFPLPEYRYFKVGDVDELSRKIQDLIKLGISDEEKFYYRRLLEEHYNWDKIARQMFEVYKSVVGITEINLPA